MTSRHLDPPDTENREDGDQPGEEDGEDLETEEEIIQRAVDESRAGIGAGSEDEEARPQERDVSVTRTDDKAKDQPIPESSRSDQADSRASSPGFSFPSLPTHAPVDESDETPNGQDGELDARMAMLLGLSGPSTLPGPSVKLPSPPKETKRKPGQGWNLPGYKDDRDDDPDSWCCK